MPTVTGGARVLLTPEQQELYDGVLTECKQNRETAVAVLDRYTRLVEEQARDVAALRAVLCADGTPETAATAGRTR